MSTNKSIIASAGVIGIATLCSRVLGFIRDMVLARLFGVYLYAQAFVVAFKIPNLFRDLVGEGAANAAIVPVFSEYRLKHSEKEFWELANVVLNLLLVILAIITLTGIMLSPIIVRLIAPGFACDPQKLEVTIRLNRIIFPYILLVSLAAYAMGVLNTLKHFSVPAFAPCFLNLSIIICALGLGEGITGLASGILIGGLLQLAIQIPVLYRKGFTLQLFQRFHHPVAVTIGQLMLPRVLSSSIYQLNNFVDSMFGSLRFIVGEGGVAVLYFSYRLIQFPLGVFSNAFSQAILPTLSTQVLEEEGEKLKDTLLFGLRMTFLVLLPATVLFIVLSEPIIRVIFQGGRFDAYSTRMTSDALSCYSIGLCAYGATKILQQCFFALKDTVTPAKISALALVVNIILNVMLMFPLKLSGLALATSLSGINTFCILLFILRKRLKSFRLKPLVVSFGRMLIASIGMGLICYFISRTVIFPGRGIVVGGLTVGLPIIAGLVSYICFCFTFNVTELHELLAWCKKKKVA